MDQDYDTKSDMWALGVVLYELLCLRRPFDGNDMDILSDEIIYTAPPPPAAHLQQGHKDSLPAAAVQTAR